MRKTCSKPPKKAGAFIYGENLNGEHSTILPYNEGRFTLSDRQYVIAKGSIDTQESAIRAGLREPAEETGLNLIAYLGEENIARMERGETVRNVTHPDFPGTMILSADPRPHTHLYHSRVGTDQPMVMYGIKVAGIENFKIKLKNVDNRTIRELIDDDPQRPRFKQFHHWLQQGYIPHGATHGRIALCDPQWFAQLVSQLAPAGRIDSRESWQDFCKNVEGNEQDYQKFRHAFSTIKQYLLREGWIRGDLDVLKFDEKDCPGYYYVEGATCDTTRSLLTHMLRDMETYPDYARAFGGQGTPLKGLAKSEMMLLGQVAALSPFIPPSIWRQAMNDAYGDKHRPRHADSIIGHGNASHRERAQNIRPPSVSAHTR